MRAVRCVEGCATVVDVAAPTGDGVRVRIVSSGVCGSDLHMLELGFFDPFTIGHEFAGHTDDGRAVAVEPIRGCGVCGLCRAGDYNRCPETLNNICGITRDGGMADAVITHRFPLDAAEEAFATAADRANGAIKVVLAP